MSLPKFFTKSGGTTPTLVQLTMPGFMSRHTVELSVSSRAEKPSSDSRRGGSGADPSTVTVSVLFFAAIATVVLNSIALGSVIGYASPFVADINSIRAPYHLHDSISISWSSSINAIGQAIGCVLVGYPLDLFGRKRVILFNAIPMVVGWVIVIASSSPAWLMVGRFVTGLSAGTVPIAIPIYLAEVAPTSLRGRICSLGPASMNLGVLYVALVACLVHYNWLAVACAAVPALMAFLFVHMPETPRWLLAHGYPDAARESLTRLRSADSDVGFEMNEIGAILGKTVLPGETDKKTKMAVGGGITFADLRNPRVYKPLSIQVILIWFQMFGGYAVVFVYSVSIFAKAHLALSPYVQSCVLCATGLLGQIFSAMLVDRFGRKPMLTVSAILMSAAMAAMGVFNFLHFDNLSWCPAVCLLWYIFGMGLGFGPIPIYIGSEMFPGRIRGAMCSISICCWSIFFFLTTKFFLPLQEVVHDYGVFWCFSIVLAFSIPFIQFVVPETTGKSLEDVQKLFH